MTSPDKFRAEEARQLDDQMLKDRYGVVRTTVDHFHVGSYRYTSLKDAIAESRRRSA
ncbi:hypothetical protein [Parvularcula sp. LCG005]|uniref:hypothetical protein n=1 Tax=Parvularcula sp. LCG005 TaxID=3078805 RepID=UPI002941CA28|nr:hypothetical protein [Parvularcula sp. LCG005]WOI52194.1 hypothetical protein RUI03_08510 [Parvularcula sp. LCG005]